MNADKIKSLVPDTVDGSAVREPSVVQQSKDVSVSGDLVTATDTLTAVDPSGVLNVGDTDIVLRKIRVASSKILPSTETASAVVLSFDPFRLYYNRTMSHNGNMSAFNDLYFEIDLEIHLTTIMSNQGLYKVIVDYNGDTPITDRSNLLSHDGVWFDLSNPVVETLKIKPVLPSTCMSFNSDLSFEKSVVTVHLIKVFTLANPSKRDPYANFSFAVTPTNFHGFNYRPASLAPQTVLSPHATYHSSPSAVNLACPVNYVKEKVTVADFGSVPGLVQSFDWPGSANFGTLLASIPVSPYRPEPSSALSYAAALHTYWSGDLTMTITVAASKLHCGLLTAVFVPRDAPFSIDTYAAYPYVELDLSTNHSRKFEIRFSAPTRKLSVIGPSRTVWTNAQSGTIKLFVGNQLTTPGETTGIVRGIVEMSSAKNTEFYVPRLPNALVPQALNEVVPRSITASRNILDACAQFQYIGTTDLRTGECLKIPVTPCLQDESFMGALGDCYTCWSGSMRFMFYLVSGTNCSIYYDPLVHGTQSFPQTHKNAIQSQPFAILDRTVNPVAEVLVPFETMFDRLYTHYKTKRVAACDNGSVLVRGTGRLAVYSACGPDFKLEQFNGVRVLEANDDLVPQGDVQPQGWFTPFNKVEDRLVSALDDLQPTLSGIAGDTSSVMSMLRRIAKLFEPAVSVAEIMSNFLNQGIDLFKTLFEVVTPSYLKAFGADFLKSLAPSSSDMSLIALVACIPLAYQQNWKWCAATVGVLSVVAMQCLPRDGSKIESLFALLGSKSEAVREGLEAQSGEMSIVELIFGCIALVLPGVFTRRANLKDLATSFNATFTAGKNLSQLTQGVIDSLLLLVAPQLATQLKGLVLVGGLDVGNFVDAVQKIDSAHYRAQPVSQRVITTALELSNQARAIEREMVHLNLNPLAARVLVKCIKVAIDENDRCTVHSKKGYIRPDPFHVMISGLPGVGKSTLTAELIRAFAGFYGFEYENNVFTLNPASKHFDGMQNQQFVVIDDAHAIQKSSSEDEDVSLIMQIKTCSEFLPPMASLEDKGRPYRAPFLITTTNVSGLPAGCSLRDPDAYLRRRNVLIRMRLLEPGDFDSAVFDLLDPMSKWEERVLEGFEGIGKQELFDHLASTSKTYFSNQRVLFDVRRSNFTSFNVEKDLAYTDALDLLVNYDRLQAQADYFDSSKVRDLLNSEAKLELVREKMAILPELTTSFLRRLQCNHLGYYLHGKEAVAPLEQETIDGLNRLLEGELFYKTLATHTVKENGKWVFTARGRSLAKHAPASLVDKLLLDLNDCKHKVREWEIAELTESVADTSWLTPMALRVLKILLCGASISAVIYWFRGESAKPMKPAPVVEPQHYDTARLPQPRRARMRPQHYDFALKDIAKRQRFHTRARAIAPQGGAPDIGDVESLVYPNVERISVFNRRMHGFLFEDRRMLVNRHFVNSAPRQLRTGDSIRLEGRCIDCVVQSIWWVGVDTDVAILTFARPVAGVRSRINMFITDAELSYAGELSGVLCRLSQTGNPLPISLSKTSCALRVADLAKEKNTIFDTVIPCAEATPLFVDGFRYTFQTSPGDCGAPLVININSPRICGIHSGLQQVTSSAAASIVTRELVEDAMTAQIEPDEISFTPVEFEEPMVEYNELDYRVSDFVKLVPQVLMDPTACELELVDVIKKSEALRVGSRTRIHTSVISPYIMAFPPTKYPSIQSRNDPRLSAELQDDGVAKEYEPLLEILNKYSKPIKPLPADLLREAADDLVTTFASMPNPLGDYDPLYYEEAINGIPGLDFYDRINLQASPGLPFTKLGFYSKRALFDEVDGQLVINSKALVDKVVELEEGVLKGEKPDIVFQEFLKDELLKPSKIYGKPNTRGIANPPLHLILVFRKYFLGLIATIMTNNADGEVSVGMNPLSAEEWTHFWERLERNSPQGFDADYTAFDSTQHPGTLDTVAYIFNKVCGGGPEIERARSILMSYCYDRVTQVGDLRFRVRQGLASGMPITAVGNSIVNSLYLRVAWLHLAKGAAPAHANMESFNTYVRASTYGDDNVVSVRSEVRDWYNLKTIAAYMAGFGIGITDGAKNSLDKVEPIVDLKQCSFLKRSRFRCPISNKERAVLPLDVIFNRLHYTKAKGIDLEDVRQRMVASLDDMFMYGERAFLDMKAVLNTIARKVGIDPIRRSYLQLYNAWLYGYKLIEPQGYSFAQVNDGVTEVYTFDEKQVPSLVNNSYVLFVDGPTPAKQEEVKRLYQWYNNNVVRTVPVVPESETQTPVESEELQKLRKKAKELEEEIEWARESNDKKAEQMLQRQTARLNEKITTLEGENKKLQESNVRLTKDKEVLTGEVAEANDRITTLRKQVKESKDRIKALEDEKSLLEKKIKHGYMPAREVDETEMRIRAMEKRLAEENNFCEKKQRDLLTCLTDCISDCLGICCGIKFQDGILSPSDNFLHLLPSTIVNDFFSGATNALSVLGFGSRDELAGQSNDFDRSLYLKVPSGTGPRPGLYFNGHGTYEVNVMGLFNDPVVGQETIAGDGFSSSGWGRAIQLFNYPSEVGDCWVIPVLRDTLERSHNVAQAIWCTLVVRKGTKIWYSRNEHGQRDVKLSKTTVDSFVGSPSFTVRQLLAGGTVTVAKNNNRPICLHFPNKLTRNVLDVGVYVQSSGWHRYAWNSATILIQRGVDNWQRGFLGTPLNFSAGQTAFLPTI